MDERLAVRGVARARETRFFVRETEPIDIDDIRSRYTSLRTMHTFLLMAGIFGALGVVTGAFGSHGLEGQVDPDLLDAWNTGVEYQMYHALALLGLACLGDVSATSLQVAGWSFAIGIVLFSGSIYGLVLTDASWLGPVTPMGGVTLIVGWIAVAVTAVQTA